MAISRDFTVKRAWAEAISDLNLENADHGQRFMLINRAQNAVAAAFPILWQMYSSRATATIDTAVNTASLAPLRANLAANGKIELESDATTAIEAVSTIEARTFNADSIHDAKRIIYSVSGNRIFFKKGSGLANYGTITIRYVRLPAARTADADYMDIPDGPAMEIFLSKLKQILRERYALPRSDDAQQMRELAQQLYQSFGVALSLEKADARIKALA